MMHFTSAMPNVPNSFYVQVICSIEQHNKHQYGLFVEPLKFKFNDVSIIDQPIIKADKIPMGTELLAGFPFTNIFSLTPTYVERF